MIKIDYGGSELTIENMIAKGDDENTVYLVQGLLDVYRHSSPSNGSIEYNFYNDALKTSGVELLEFKYEAQGGDTIM